jgi:hypothetical protein
VAKINRLKTHPSSDEVSDDLFVPVPEGGDASVYNVAANIGASMTEPPRYEPPKTIISTSTSRWTTTKKKKKCKKKQRKRTSLRSLLLEPFRQKLLRLRVWPMLHGILTLRLHYLIPSTNRVQRPLRSRVFHIAATTDPSHKTEAVEVTTRSGPRDRPTETEEEGVAADRAVFVAAEEAFLFARESFDDEPKQANWLRR